MQQLRRQPPLRLLSQPIGKILASLTAVALASLVQQGRVWLKAYKAMRWMEGWRLPCQAPSPPVLIRVLGLWPRQGTRKPKIAILSYRQRRNRRIQCECECRQPPRITIRRQRAERNTAI